MKSKHGYTRICADIPIKDHLIITNYNKTAARPYQFQKIIAAAIKQTIKEIEQEERTR